MTKPSVLYKRTLKTICRCKALRKTQDFHSPILIQYSDSIPAIALWNTLAFTSSREARLELRRTSKTVLEIALDFGYASPESFTRAFKNFYSITPSEYRKKYMDEAVTWHDLSGKIAISRFRRTFPELNVSDIDLALDFCFTHNPLKYAEDIVGMTVAESEILTLGNSEPLEHFVYVSDYNSAVPAVALVCETESDALPYLKLLEKLTNPRFSVRKSVDTEWESFYAEVAKLGLTCRCRIRHDLSQRYGCCS